MGGLPGDSAIALESEHPGLWKTALHYIEAASRISVPIRMPETIYYLNGYLWEEWGVIKSRKDIPKDESVRELLEYNFAGDDDEIERFLPSSILKLLGDDLAIPVLNTKKQRLSQKQVKQIAKDSRDAFSAVAADLLLKLVKAVHVAKRANARMPDLSDLNCESTEPGCTLIFKHDDLIYQCINNNYQELMQDGRATHWTGLDELPTTPLELATYFNKLDLALKVLMALDDLLCHVTEPYIED